MELEWGSTRSQALAKTLWKRLWTYLKTDCTVVMTSTGGTYRGSALLSAAPSWSVDLVIKNRVQEEIRLYFTIIKIHKPTGLLSSYAYFCLYLSTDSLYVKFVAITWEFHIAAMTVVVDLQKVFYILYYMCLFCMSVLHSFLSERPYWVRPSSVSRLTDHTKTPYSVGLLWESDQRYAETCTLTTHKALTRRTSLLLEEFERAGSEHP
jgi:hypothetical protein